MPDIQRDLTRTVLAVLFIGGLLGFSLWILRPFLVSLIWAVTIVVASWPLMRVVQSALWGRRWLAVTAMTLALLLLLIVPFTAAIITIVSNVDTIVGWVKAISEFAIPPPPAWLGSLPIIGEAGVQLWQEQASGDVEALTAKVVPYAGVLSKWFVAQVGNLGVVFVEILLTVVVSAILFAHGEQAAAWMRRFGRRIGGESGDAAMLLSAQAIRGVALGVVVTALVQALLGGLGLAVAGVPFVAILTAVMFMLSVAQIGAIPVLLPAVIWLYSRDDVLWGSVLLVVMVVVSLLDNVLRPILIKKGANLPLLLVFAGVIGGLIAFGLIGIFIGPMVLAISYTLLSAWIEQRQSRS
ncbi:MAG TPA: AI-2E family transporter YdiK [Acidiferrobacterales bacterium]|nr:AI-2E family transporter YdiK [Acidiferrobacterales bacterium]